MAEPKRSSARLDHIDWMRGLACVLMFQTHCYDSWLSPEARKSAVFAWSQLAGTLPAPLFIFLAGISVALVTERQREKGIGRNAIARQTILRGAEVFALGVLFRVQEFVLGFRTAPWTDLLRVDVLNILGISMMLMGVVCWVTAGATGPLKDSAKMVRRERNTGMAGGIAVAAAISTLTPPLWTTWRPSFLRWPIESYINGVHIYGTPQPWLFPLFPWSAFAFAGLAVGFFLFTQTARWREALTFFGVGVAGVAVCGLSFGLDAWPFRLYAVYDYWHSAPSFLLMRCGILLVILGLAYFWCWWGLPSRIFSPLVQLGKTSLLVYWVHIDFVYGGLSILPKRQCSVTQASVGLLIIFLAMLGLSLVRTWWKDRRRSRVGVPSTARA